MAATLITYADGVVTPFLDGIMQELYTSGGGLITGGTITISGASTLHITQAHGALCGREFSIDDGDYSVQLSSSGTKLGRIYLHMDLSNTANPLEVLIETGSSLTPVQQDADVNETNGVYEINLATFDVDESTISNLVSVAPTIKTLAERTLQTVSDCVNSTDPQDIAGAAAVSMLNSKIAQTDYVSVTADGVKTYKQLLNSLYTLIDRTKLTYQSVYVEDFGNNEYQILPVSTVNPTNITCVRANVSTKNQIRCYILNASGSIRQTATGGDNVVDNSSLVPTSGTKLEFHY